MCAVEYPRLPCTCSSAKVSVDSVVIVKTSLRAVVIIKIGFTVVIIVKITGTLWPS